MNASLSSFPFALEMSMFATCACEKCVMQPQIDQRSLELKNISEQACIEYRIVNLHRIEEDRYMCKQTKANLQLISHLTSSIHNEQKTST